MPSLDCNHPKSAESYKWHALPPSNTPRTAIRLHSWEMAFVLKTPSGDVVANANWPRRLIFWASIAAILFLCVWYAFDVFLLAFAGALLAILLHTCADWVEHHTPRSIGPKLSYTATILGIVLVTCVVAYLVIPHVIVEAGQVTKIIPHSVKQLTDYLRKTDWGRFLVATAQRLFRSSSSLPMTTLTTSLGKALEDAVVILVVGLYGALDARGYTQGLLALIPQKHRPAVAEVSERVVYTLRWWVIGQLVPMVALGTATMIGLWCLGVPLAFVLGLFTGVMIFVPYIGSWIAFIPAVLVSFTAGMETALSVAVLYLIVHAFEGYVLTPLVQKRAVLLPPVLTILSQFFLWEVSGLLGVALATPLAAAGLVLIKTLYLHEEVEH